MGQIDYLKVTPILRHIIIALFCLILPSLSVLAAPPKPDADMQRLLDTWAAFGGRPLEQLSATEARAQPTLQTAIPVLLRKQGRSVAPEAVAKVERHLIPGPDGDLQALVYTPEGEGPFPLLVFFHGGGWVLGGLGASDASARALTNAADCVVVSIGYRQAPEHPYPAAIKDAQAAFLHISENATDYNGDRKRVAIGGEESGANLAAAVCLMQMAAGGEMPVHQLLICPITNFAFDTPSYRRNAQAKPIGKGDMQWFFSQYLRTRKDGSSPYVSVLRKNVADLPSATVIVAELDPLRSEGEAYHKHLLNQAVESQIGIYTGVTQGFFGTGAVVAKAKKATVFAGRRLRKAFTVRRPGSTTPGSGPK